jgi:hypothetical protein
VGTDPVDCAFGSGNERERWRPLVALYGFAGNCKQTVFHALSAHIHWCNG